MELFPHNFKSAGKYVDITLTDDEADNRNKLDAARLQIRALRISADNTRGIHFHFDENMPYEIFIQVLDICKRERVRTFVPEGSDLWIFNFVPKPNPDYVPNKFVCETPWPIDIDDAPQPYTESNKEKLWTLTKSMLLYAPSAAFFLIMIVSSLRFNRRLF